MQLDPEALAVRRRAKIATFTARRDALRARLTKAQHTEKWRVKALLVSAERKLRWQVAREVAYLQKLEDIRMGKNIAPKPRRVELPILAPWP